MYVREKAEDGKRYQDRSLPSFEAVDLENTRVISDDLRGSPVVLAFLAGHCTHSLDSLPLLQEVSRTYRSRGLRVVTVIVNSGTADDVGEWISHYEPEYDVWVVDDDSIGNAVGAHLVPTYLFLDPEGRVRQKIVGFKESEELLGWISGMMPTGDPLTGL